MGFQGFGNILMTWFVVESCSRTKQLAELSFLSRPPACQISSAANFCWRQQHVDLRQQPQIRQPSKSRGSGHKLIYVPEKLDPKALYTCLYKPKTPQIYFIYFFGFAALAFLAGRGFSVSSGGFWEAFGTAFGAAFGFASSSFS